MQFSYRQQHELFAGCERYAVPGNEDSDQIPRVPRPNFRSKQAHPKSFTPVPDQPLRLVFQLPTNSGYKPVMNLERIFAVSEQICILDLANDQPHPFVPDWYREQGI